MSAQIIDIDQARERIRPEAARERAWVSWFRRKCAEMDAASEPRQLELGVGQAIESERQRRNRLFESIFGRCPE